ncbi:hypothetical protein [Flaviaesturariibacter terrae]
MKRILTLCALFLTLAASAQNTLRAGAKGSAYKGISTAYGGEVVASFSIHKFNIGTGVDILYFEKLADVAVPAYITAGFDLNDAWSFHVDGGKVLYGRNTAVDGKTLRQDGDLYLGAGARYNLTRRFYVGAQYSRYGFKLKGFDATYSDAATLSIGVRLKG